MLWPLKCVVVQGEDNSSDYILLVNERPLFSDPVFIHCDHKNHNPLDYDWFQKLLFSTNSLNELLSDSLLSVQEANHIQSCSLNQLNQFFFSGPIFNYSFQ